MNAPADESNKRPLLLEPLLGWVRLDGHWRGQVLLQLGDGAEVLGQNWPDVTVDDWASIISDPSKLFEPDTEGQMLKDGDSTRVVLRKLKLGKSQVKVVCKLSGRRNFLRKTHGLFRRSRPSRNWQMGWNLLKEGIATALPVAVLEKRILGVRVGAIIITRSLFPGKNLEHFMCEDASGLEPGVQRQLSKELADLVGRLHKRGFFHRDLKGVNIFVQLAGQRYVRLYLVDLDGCYHNGRGYSKKVKSLGRLARASLNWKMYLREFGQDQKYWKRWWRSIDCEVRRKLLQRKRRSESA